MMRNELPVVSPVVVGVPVEDAELVVVVPDELVVESESPDVTPSSAGCGNGRSRPSHPKTSAPARTNATRIKG